MKVITLENVHKSFGKREVINIEHLEIESGKFYGFVGPNGAGKSTTINMIMDFIHPTKGKIEVFGIDAQKNSALIKKRIGFVPGEIEYYKNIKVKTFIKYATGFYDNVDQEYLKHLIEVLKVETNKKLTDLSLGNRKKVAIVLALMHKPELLILDEATNGLDPLIKSEFFKLIKELQENGTTIFMSSHVLSEIEEECEIVLFIKDGKIIRQIDVKEVSEKLGYTYSYLLDNQKVGKSYDGKLSDLLLELSKLEIHDLKIEKETITSQFRHLYEEGD